MCGCVTVSNLIRRCRLSRASSMGNAPVTSFLPRNVCRLCLMSADCPDRSSLRRRFIFRTVRPPITVIVIHAVFPLNPETRDEALDLIADLADASSAEPGITDYRPATDVDDPNVVRFFEQYEDAAAFEAHTQTDHFQEFEAALPDLLGGEPEVTRYEVDSASQLDL